MKLRQRVRLMAWRILNPRIVRVDIIRMFNGQKIEVTLSIAYILLAFFVGLGIAHGIECLRIR